MDVACLSSPNAAVENCCLATREMNPLCFWGLLFCLCYTPISYLDVVLDSSGATL